VLDGTILPEVHPRFRDLAEAGGFASAALWTELAARGRVGGLAAVPAAVQRRFPTAYEVAPADHVRMQAIFQGHVHAAVSKTVNLAASATVEDVDAVYRLAYRLGCKGVTIYRDGSRAEQVLSTGATPGAAAAAPAATCPECGDALVVQVGCRLCRACGWSICG
jgi:ribonucleoside-diphosphate reductase alpha chain